MKCDERKPACNRCVSTGRTCDGEIGTASVSATRHGPIVPRLDAARSNIVRASAKPSNQVALISASSETASTLPSLQHPVSAWQSISSGLTDYERHGFSHFQILTAPALRMALPSSDWIPVALQASVQHPAVFHAITATGTMARGLTVLIHPSFARPILQEQADEAMRQYQKAIKVLRTYVDAAASSSVDVEPILLACLLCVCFEAFCGRKSAAIEHARLGWEITKSRPASTQMHPNPSAKFFDLVFRARAGAFALFDDKEHHSLECCTERLNLSGYILNSMEEATYHLNKLTKLSEHLRADLLQLAKADIAGFSQSHELAEGLNFCWAACLSRTIAISETQKTRLEQLRLGLMQWKSAYSTYEATRAQDNVETHLILLIKHFYSSFTLATCRDSEEIQSDQYHGDFIAALDLIERYLAVADRGASEEAHPSAGTQSDQTRSLFFGNSILPALDVIAHKCRDPQQKRRALHILSTAQKQEGLEHSKLLSYYAQAAIEIEEHRGKSLTRSSPSSVQGSLQIMLAEQARFADVVTVGQGVRVLRLLCARYVHDNPGPKQIELAVYERGTVPLRLCFSWRVDV